MQTSAHQLDAASGKCRTATHLCQGLAAEVHLQLSGRGPGHKCMSRCPCKQRRLQGRALAGRQAGNSKHCCLQQVWHQDHLVDMSTAAGKEGVAEQGGQEAPETAGKLREDAVESGCRAAGHSAVCSRSWTPRHQPTASAGVWNASCQWPD